MFKEPSVDIICDMDKNPVKEFIRDYLCYNINKHEPINVYPNPFPLKEGTVLYSGGQYSTFVVNNILISQNKAKLSDIRDDDGNVLVSCVNSGTANNVIIAYLVKEGERDYYKAYLNDTAMDMYINANN